MKKLFFYSALICALVGFARQSWKVEDAITEMKDGGYGYHSIWFHLPSFIRKTAKELK